MHRRYFRQMLSIIVILIFLVLGILRRKPAPAAEDRQVASNRNLQIPAATAAEPENVMNKETNRRRYCSGNTKNALHRHTKGLFRRGLEERSQ